MSPCITNRRITIAQKIKVISKNNTKASITILTTDGVVNVKFTKDVTPGKYYYIARFYNANDVLLMPYIEEVYVDPGNTSTKKITLGDVINVPPAAPSELDVTYIANTLGTATIEFSWRDNAINETGFVLEVTEYTDPTTPAGDPVIYDENTVLREHPEYIDGNLIARPDTVKPTFTINIKTGTFCSIPIFCAILSAKAVFPIDGRAATSIRSEGCKPAVL